MLIIYGLSAGLLMGVTSGLLGIGGGIILVPILLYLFKMGTAQAAGTSLAVIVPTAIAGVLAHMTKGTINWKLAVLLAAGGAVGAVFGARLSTILPEIATKRIFAVLLVLVAVRIFVDTRVSAGPARGEDVESRPGASATGHRPPK